MSESSEACATKANINGNIPSSTFKRQTTVNAHLDYYNYIYKTHKEQDQFLATWWNQVWFEPGFSQILSITKHWQKKWCQLVYQIKPWVEHILTCLIMSETLRSWTQFTSSSILAEPLRICMLKAERVGVVMAKNCNQQSH